MNDWNADLVPPQHGRVAVVTGANSGLGLSTAAALARHGARVVLAVRDVPAGERAADEIRKAAPRAALEVRRLDLASLGSVREFAAGLTADHPAIDLLVNNAGVVLLGERRTTVDGFELHFATNVLGHFALTGLLLDALDRAELARVVHVSSLSHKKAVLDFHDLMSEKDFDASRAYGRSKLGTTAFGLEMDRRLRASRSRVTSVLAHPGLTSTNLTPRAWENHGFMGGVAARLFLLRTQSVERGVLPQLYAATALGVSGGQFFGPSGKGERRGHVAEVRPSAEAADPTVGSRLWAAAQDLTGVSYL
ncbi:oxidoreductase [Streptomyces levis]|uniref:oxidoreductase n=1 Tax=Streptomyces levis TaxID=285566 RepID=UPI003C7997D1